MIIDESVHEYLEREKILPDGHVLYVGVRGGGCSGLSYVFQVVSPTADHIVLSSKVVSDKKSMLFLKNTVLKYKQSVGASILVVENPNAVSTCGCGESFSV